MSIDANWNGACSQRKKIRRSDCNISLNEIGLSIIVKWGKLFYVP
jgi:hypothetical protein